MTSSTKAIVDRPTERHASSVDTRSTPVTVIGDFTLVPGRQDMWLGVWRNIARIARTQPTCDEFRLLRNRSDSTRCSILSRWDDVSAFNRFVREVHLLWVERAMPYSRLPTHFAVFETVQDEPVDDVSLYEEVFLHG